MVIQPYYKAYEISKVAKRSWLAEHFLGDEERMRRRRKNKTGIGIITFLVLIICGIVSYRGFGLAQEKSEKEVQIERLKTKIEAQKEREDEIDDFQKYAKTNQYIEKIAREKLGLVYKDEVIIKPEK
jgi:cell division protein DivIC